MPCCIVSAFLFLWDTFPSGGKETAATTAAKNPQCSVWLQNSTSILDIHEGANQIFGWV